jgi:predicted ribosome quality control (RQC) complex YloA/Tae2 family protein
MELAGVELQYAVRELQSMVGAKVEKIFQSERKRDLLFIMYLRDSPKVHLRFVLPGIVCTVKTKPDYPTSPPGFAMFLRKYLSGTRLEAVEQAGLDRIIKLAFASKTEKFTLVAEFLPPGNMLLLDGDGRIINLLEAQQTKDRSLRGRQPYVLPPAAINVLAMSDDELARHIIASTKDSLVTTLAINCSLGGIYAEEVCIRAEVAKHRNNLNTAEVQKVVAALREVLGQSLQAHTDGQRAYPFKLRSREVTPCEESSYLAALSSFITEEQQDKHEAKMQQRQAPKNKLQNMIDAQTAQIKKCEEDAVTEQRKAELIFEEYQIVQEILQAAKHAREHKQNIEEALKKYPQVKNYKPATGEIEIELGDA